MVSTKIKLEIKGRLDMTSVTGSAMTRSVTLVQIGDFSGFKHCWKRLGTLEVHKSTKYNIVLVVFGYFPLNIFHIVPLILLILGYDHLDAFLCHLSFVY